MRLAFTIIFVTLLLMPLASICQSFTKRENFAIEYLFGFIKSVKDQKVFKKFDSAETKSIQLSIGIIPSVREINWVVNTNLMSVSIEDSLKNIGFENSESDIPSNGDNKISYTYLNCNDNIRLDINRENNGKYLYHLLRFEKGTEKNCDKQFNWVLRDLPKVNTGDRIKGQITIKLKLDANGQVLKGEIVETTLNSDQTELYYQAILKTGFKKTSSNLSSYSVVIKNKRITLIIE